DVIRSAEPLALVTVGNDRTFSVLFKPIDISIGHCSNNQPAFGIQRQSIGSDQKNGDAPGNRLRAGVRIIASGETAVLQENRKRLIRLPFIDHVSSVVAEEQISPGSIRNPHWSFR